jgi:thiamine-monophosphate kinase
MRGEFDLIARYFAPLAGDAPGSFGLQDDAAVFEPPAGRVVVATLDTLVAGVHFLPQDEAGLVARKLLRVNLSDLAAMGARAEAYLLSLSLTRDAPEAWVADFAEGLAADQREFGCRLLGGDTTATPGPTSLSLTLLGSARAEHVLSRGGAQAGDLLYVSGTIGDAALGLKVLRGEIGDLKEADAAFLAERYRLPRPRADLGMRLAEEALATAAIDISDGLVADLGHICETSGLAASVEISSLPLSQPTRAALGQDPSLLQDVVAGGDDYELLFTATPGTAERLEAVARELGCPVRRIGQMSEGSGMVMHDESGKPVEIGRAGWTHF